MPRIRATTAPSTPFFVSSARNEKPKAVLTTLSECKVHLAKGCPACEEKLRASREALLALAQSLLTEPMFLAGKI